MATKNPAEPGSKSFIESDPVNQALLTEQDKRAILRYSNEEIEERNSKLPEPSGVKVIKDEWYGSIEQANPYDKAVAPFIRDNPDKSFRFQDANVMARLGDSGFQKVVDPETGKNVEAGGQVLTFMPKSEHEKLERREREFAQSQMGAKHKEKEALAEEGEGLRHIGGISVRREGEARSTVIEGHSSRAF